MAAGRCAAVLREVWSEDPYIDDGRRGTMFSLIEAHHPKTCGRSITGARLSQFGRLMMYAPEHRELQRMAFPRLAYRGGSGVESEVRKGRSWTFQLKTARFFAEDWPRRAGLDDVPIVLQMRITRDDVICYLNDRQEQEAIVIGHKGENLKDCIRVI